MTEYAPFYPLGPDELGGGGRGGNGQRPMYDNNAHNVYDNQTRLTDDPCYLDCRANTSRKQIKYITRNFRDLENNMGQAGGMCNPPRQFLNHVTMQSWDGPGVPACNIDVDSHLRIDPILTNLGFPQQLPTFPAPTIPYLGKGCYNPEIEMDLRGQTTSEPNSCLPRETNYYERHFDFFDHLCYNPNNVDHTVYPVNQAGMDTRHLLQSKLRGSG